MSGLLAWTVDGMDAIDELHGRTCRVSTPAGPTEPDAPNSNRTDYQEPTP